MFSPQKDIDSLLTNDERAWFNSKNIILHPYVTDVRHVYSRSSIIVHCSAYGEGISRVVLEAGSFGIPLIVYYNAGITPVIPDSSYGTILAQPHPILIASSINTIIMNPSDTERKTNMLSNRIHKFFSSDISTESVLSILSELSISTSTIFLKLSL